MCVLIACGVGKSLAQSALNNSRIQPVGGNGGGQHGGNGAVGSRSADAGMDGSRGSPRTMNWIGASSDSWHLLTAAPTFRDGKAGGASHTEAFAGQRLAHSGQLRRGGRGVEVFQPVGGQVFLGGTQAECPFLRHAVNAMSRGGSSGRHGALGPVRAGRAVAVQVKPFLRFQQLRGDASAAAVSLSLLLMSRTTCRPLCESQTSRCRRPRTRG